MSAYDELLRGRPRKFGFRDAMADGPSVLTFPLHYGATMPMGHKTVLSIMR